MAIHERLGDILLNLPFMLSVSAEKRSFSAQRIGEALIIAILTAAGTSYMTVHDLQKQFEYLQHQFDEQRTRRDAEINGMKSDMKEMQVRQQMQYETLKDSIQRVALAVEKRK